METWLLKKQYGLLIDSKNLKIITEKWALPIASISRYLEQIFQLNTEMPTVYVSKIHYSVRHSTDLPEKTSYNRCLQRLQKNLRILSTKRRNWRAGMILFACYVQLIVKSQRLIVLHQQNSVSHLWYKRFSLEPSPIGRWQAKPQYSRF